MPIATPDIFVDGTAQRDVGVAFGRDIKLLDQRPENVSPDADFAAGGQLGNNATLLDLARILQATNLSDLTATVTALANFQNIFPPRTAQNDGQILEWDDSTNAFIWVDKPTGGGGTVYAAPAITAFSINGWSSNLSDRTDAGGSRTITYAVSNDENVQGDLTLTVNGSQEATDIQADGTSYTVSLPSRTLRLGESSTAVLSGTNTNGESFSRSLTARVPDPFYFGSDAASSISGISGMQSATYANPQRATVSAWTGDRYIYFAQLASRPDFESIFVGGFDQIAAYEKQSNITVSGATYEVWRSSAQQVASFYPAGYSARITRG